MEAANTAHSETKTKLEAANGQITTLKATIDDPQGELKAGEIARGQGVNPVIEAPAPANPQTSAPAKPALKGRARLEAAIASEFSQRK